MYGIHNWLKASFNPKKKQLMSMSYVEDNYTKEDILGMVYPLMKLLHALHTYTNIRVGILMNENVLWTSTYIACIMVGYDTIIIPPVHTKEELKGFITDSDINVLLVSRENPFEVEQVNVEKNVFYTLPNISLVYDVAHNETLYAKDRIRNTILLFENYKSEVPKSLSWLIAASKHNKGGKLISSSSAVSRPIPALYYTKFKNLDIVLRGLSKLFDEIDWIFDTIYIDAPKWKYHLLTILLPHLEEKQVSRSYDLLGEYDVAIFDSHRLKEVVDNNYYYYFISRFLRTSIPHIILKWLGKLRLKRLLRKVPTIIILNYDLPNIYVDLLRSIKKKVITTYGCVECNQLAGYTVRDNQKKDYVLETILPTVIIEEGSLRQQVPSTISGKGIAHELNIVNTVNNAVIDDVLVYNDFAELFEFTSRISNLKYISDTDIVLGREVENYFRSSPYVREAKLVKAFDDYNIVILLSNRFAESSNITLVEMEAILDKMIVSFNKTSPTLKIAQAIINPSLRLGYDGTAVSWPYNEYYLHEIMKTGAI